MRMNVTLVGDRELIAKFERLPFSIVEVLRPKVTELALMLQGYIQREKLSGQVLRVVTGALRRSIHAQPTQVVGDTVIGSVASSGDVKYAAVHEFGFRGDVTVKQHMRDTVFGRKVEAFSVGPYTMHMNVPERSFMRTGLADKQDYIAQQLSGTVRTHVQGLFQ